MTEIANMRRGACLCGALLAAAALGGCASAPSGDGESVRVKAGASATLTTTFMTMNDECRATRRPRLSLAEPPSLGAVRFTTMPAAAQYGEGSMRHCHGKVGASSAIVYTAPASAGVDAFVVRVVYADGETRRAPFHVTIAP